ncbi:MAG: hypothetical protein ACP5OG_03855 [Candidatus Nanoarchaeia archaeon]
MGGCYHRSESEIREERRRQSERDANEALKNFSKSQDFEILTSTYNSFMQKNKSGFIEFLAKGAGIENVCDIPKEFNEIEYEVKFDISLDSCDNEPKLEEILNAFDFPATRRARFLKDPVNIVNEGVNNFYGSNGDEKLVVIEKAGSIYLKEKGPVIPLDLGIDFEDIVVKRTEKRWQSSFEEASRKIEDIKKEYSAEYKGKIRKEKGDAFILDINDGRIYSFTITRAHLIKPGENKESGLQRQLEIEYAGYVPGFNKHEKDSEKQIVQGMVDLAKYTFVLYNHSPLGKSRMNLAITNQRKYDFVTGKQLEDNPCRNVLVPMLKKASVIYEPVLDGK